MSQPYYALRAKRDGRHLAAQGGTDDAPVTFLLLFTADHEALSYLSAHAPDLRDHFAVEFLSSRHLAEALDRWGFGGVGLVRDALTPQIDFRLRTREQP